jgi:hypothetical protein
MRLLHPKRMFHFLCFLIVLAFIIYFNFFYLVYYSLFYIDKDFHIKPESRRFDSNVLQLKSQCECRKDETIYLLKEHLDKSYVVKSVLTTNKSTETYSTMETILYQISQDRLQSSILTCDWYNSLRRGPNLKVISYSLYGRNRFYYNFIRDLVKIAKKLYPGWIVRIHYDSSIDESIICEIECLKHLNEVTQKEEYLDNTDFCNIEKLPYDMKSTWNVSYMHGERPQVT